MTHFSYTQGHGGGLLKPIPALIGRRQGAHCASPQLIAGDSCCFYLIYSCAIVQLQGCHPPTTLLPCAYCARCFLYIRCWRNVRSTGIPWYQPGEQQNKGDFTNFANENKRSFGNFLRPCPCQPGYYAFANRVASKLQSNSLWSEHEPD